MRGYRVGEKKGKRNGATSAIPGEGGEGGREQVGRNNKFSGTIGITAITPLGFETPVRKTFPTDRA